uniref:Uncharacterized protein n=1 Tax=Acrobeloides nanus TaxID=290746 RepID=A0A914EL69_9BILA
MVSAVRRLELNGIIVVVEQLRSQAVFLMELVLKVWCVQHQNIVVNVNMDKPPENVPKAVLMDFPVHQMDIAVLVALEGKFHMVGGVHIDVKRTV